VSDKPGMEEGVFAMPVSVPATRQQSSDGAVTISAVAPGGMARHWRVQVQPTAGPWRNVGACLSSQAAQQRAAEYAQRGCRVRIVGYRTAPTAA
jgi:hypothetical protein